MIRTTTVGCQPLPAPPVLLRDGREIIVAPDKAHFLASADGRSELEAMHAALVRRVIDEQIEIGLDVVSEGEVSRRDYWSYFTNTTEWDSAGPPFLRVALDYPVADWSLAQSFTTAPVKMTLPGPMTCAQYAWRDRKARLLFPADHPAMREDNSFESISLAYAECLNSVIRSLAARGCRYIQLDDCQLVYQSEAALEFGYRHVGACFEGVGNEVARVLHICRGTPGFIDSYGHGKAPDMHCYQLVADFADDLPVDMISFEQAFCPSPPTMYSRIRKRTLMIGVVDVATPEVETVDEIVRRIDSVLPHLAGEEAFVSPDCGMSAWRYSGNGPDMYERGLTKLRNMVEAVRIVNGRP